MLGCTYPGESKPRSVFETTLDGGGAPSVVDHGFAECGKRALRNTNSRMLVDTVEDALRQRGVALIGERFRLNSGIGWVLGENVTGELDALIPLLDGENSEEPYRRFSCSRGRFSGRVSKARIVLTRTLGLYIADTSRPMSSLEDRPFTTTTSSGAVGGLVWARTCKAVFSTRR